MVPFDNATPFRPTTLLLVSTVLVVLSALAKGASALPELVFWNNTDWPSDLDPVVGDPSSLLLEGTVLFAQSQILPSKHGIEKDSQPHLTALRKTLVLLRPHQIEDNTDEASVSDIGLTVRDANGISLSGGTPIVMNHPEDIPKQEGWIDLGTVDDIVFPVSLENPYEILGKANLERIAGSSNGSNEPLAQLFQTENTKVKARTWDGSWVRDIYLPEGLEVPEGSKFQLTVGSTWAVNLHYQHGTKRVSKDETLVLVMVSDVWVAPGDPAPSYRPRFPTSLESPHVIKSKVNLQSIGNDPSSVNLGALFNDPAMVPTQEIEIRTRDGAWVKDIYLPEGASVPPNSKLQVTCDSGYKVNVYYPNTVVGGWRKQRLSRGEVLVLVLTPHKNVWVSKDDLAHNDYVFGHGFYTASLDATWVTPGMTLEFARSNQKGILEATVGGTTELVMSTIDAGFLTEPRNEFAFAVDPTLHREYFETAPISRLVVAQYETVHWTEIMLPTGKFYTEASDEEGGVYAGDLRQLIGKMLISHGIDNANYGEPSSKGVKPDHPFTCAYLTAHNTVGMYQNGRVEHGLSGGNGIVTLLNSIGNEMSHEIGHNYGLGHYPGGFDGSVHAPADKINSAWAWDSERNLFRPNFWPSATGSEICLDEICRAPFLGKYQYGKDAMAGGGGGMYGSNRYTMHTPYVTEKIQTFLEKKAVWDPSSSTGFRQWDPASKTMEEFVGGFRSKVPRLYRVPVTTLVGYYDPDPVRALESYIYPALHGAYGFVYEDEGGSTNGTPNGCELVVETSQRGTLVFDLGTDVDSQGMNKFHVNLATEDEPEFARVYCYGTLRASRALEGPSSALAFTVNGLAFDETTPTHHPTQSPTTPEPTLPPTDRPTLGPTSVEECADTPDDQWTYRGKPNKHCSWLSQRSEKKRQNFCKRRANAKPDKTKVRSICKEACDACPERR